jgi:hypothetical protein
MAIDLNSTGGLYYLGDAAGVVVMPMTQHKRVRLAYIHTQRSGVRLKSAPLSRIKKDMLALSFYPEREPMLGGQSRCGPVVDQDGYPKRMALHLCPQ